MSTKKGKLKSGRRAAAVAQPADVGQTSSSRQSAFASAELVGRLLANADVWERIFAFLAAKDRIRVERVNKRLRTLMLTFWKRVTFVDIAAVVSPLNGGPLQKGSTIHFKKRAAAVVAICVGRMGVSLRSLKLWSGTILSMDWRADLGSIAAGCPNIESIHFHINRAEKGKLGTFIAPSNLRFNAFLNLKSLTFTSSSETDSTFVEASAAVFLSIPPSIESIVGLSCLHGDGVFNENRFETPAQLEAFFAERPSLREVRLRRLGTRDGSKADIFPIIAKRCPQLKSIDFDDSDIDVHGVVELSAMRELRLKCLMHAYSLSNAEVITICGRSPRVEILELNMGDCGDDALNAIAALTNLHELVATNVGAYIENALNPTSFVCALVCSSGASLRRFVLSGYDASLPTAAIEALANGCTKLRWVSFRVHVAGATPQSIRFLIDSIVADSSWSPTTEELKVDIEVLDVRREEPTDLHGDYDAPEFAPFLALSAHLPAGVRLDIRP